MNLARTDERLRREIKDHYDQHPGLKQEREMSAFGARMRRLLHTAFGMLKHQTNQNPALVSKNA